jgi:hypothetical protein
LDNNFATAITIGNTAVYLGNTTTSFGNVTLNNANITSLATTFPNSFLANSTTTIGNTTVTLGSTSSSIGNLTLNNVTIASGNATVTKITAPTHDAGSGSALTLQSNSTTGLYIDTSQNVGIGTTSPSYKLSISGGNIGFSSGTNGIIFNNSSALANSTLNDYETGTWTPTVGGTATYTSRTATYTKVGRMVTAYVDMAINAIGTGSTTTVSGLPFTAIGNHGGSFAYYSGLSTAIYWISPQINGTTFWTIYSTAANTQPNGNASNFLTSGTRIIVTLTYEASF